MFGVSFIAGAYRSKNISLEANRSQRGRFGPVPDRDIKLDASLRKRVEEMDRKMAMQLMTGKDAAIHCPECLQTMIRVILDDIELDACPRCRGFWFDHGELAHFTKEHTDVPSGHLTSRDSRYRCPHCDEPMRESVFKAPFNLLVDRCPNGHGVYCEAQEFEWALGL